MDQTLDGTYVPNYFLVILWFFRAQHWTLAVKTNTGKDIQYFSGNIRILPRKWIIDVIMHKWILKEKARRSSKENVSFRSSFILLMFRSFLSKFSKFIWKNTIYCSFSENFRHKRESYNNFVCIIGDLLCEKTNVNRLNLVHNSFILDFFAVEYEIWNVKISIVNNE